MTVRRKIGEATTVHERNVESAIGRVPEWHGREANYASLVGGLMNLPPWWTLVCSMARA
jgi:hypothetical protein